MELRKTFEKLCIAGASHKEMEYMDREISHVLDQARKCAGGPMRRVLFSKKKVKLTSVILHWRARLGLKKW